MTSPRRLFLIFIAALAGIALAMGWVTWQAVELERSERRARADARFQDSIRLSLWRMDSLLAAILARESARPYFEFQPFYPAQRAYTRMFEPVQPGEVLVPSPLLAGGHEFIRLYFQLGPDGRLTSPQSPSGNMRDLAESAYVEPELIMRAEQQLDALSRLGVPTDLAALPAARFDRAPSPPPAASEARGQVAPETGQSKSPQFQAAEEYAARQRQADLSNRPQTTIAPPPQIARVPGSPTSSPLPDAERSAGLDNKRLADTRDRDDLREQTRALSDTLEQRTDSAIVPGRAAEPLGHLQAHPSAPDLEQGPYHALWLRVAGGDPELVFIRRVELQSQSLHQGLWLDWPVVRQRLLASIADLLPDAALQPVPDPRPASPDEVGRLLATIPVRLVAGPAPELPIAWWTPRRATLLLSWIAMIGAGLTVFSVLRGSIALSERRGRFVSAVTHELRTPLTTFRLYSEMLADGMVTDEQARRDYLDTLKSESRRLARVVEDVLDYARLSRPKPRRRPEPVAASELLAQCRPELQRRAARGGLELIDETAALLSRPEARLAADPRSVERILLNLVDNACKYADGPDRRLHLSARLAHGHLIIHVADHGPGIPDRDAARIFHPFERGRTAEHQSEPGLGLGLALSRGLAAELGGELRLVRGPDFGAIFELSLPLS